MTQSPQRPVFFSSIAGLLTACVAFAVVLFLANVVLYLLNLIRGTENSWLETVFRELASPAAGAYAAMLLVHKLIKAYNKAFVFFGFSALMIAFVAASLTLMYVVWRSGHFSLYDLIMQGLIAPVAISAAYYAYKNEMTEHDAGLPKKADSSAGPLERAEH